MISFYSTQHAGHAPACEIFRGERVPCFETPARAELVRAELERRGHRLLVPDADSSVTLSSVHDRRYLDFLASAWTEWQALAEGNEARQPFPAVWPIRSLRSDEEPRNFIARLGLYSMDSGTPISAGTWSAAKSGADAAQSAAIRLVQGARGVFCATRPPGHHAGKDFMGGYCFLNNAAVVAEALLASGASRVAILDLDYHHGNGTQSLFYERADVFFASLHGDPRTEYPFYLGHADETGRGEGLGFNLNLPLPAGCARELWFEALAEALRRLGGFRPDALVVSLGLDTCANDPISTFSLRTDDYCRVGALIGYFGRPAIFVLEGGYAVADLGVNAVNVLEGFEQV